MTWPDVLAAEAVQAGLPEPEREYRFYPPRKWRLDLAWPPQMIAVEIEGGVWIGGRHVRGVGFEKDLEKYNTAATWGWRLLRYTPAMVEDGRALAGIREAFRATGIVTDN